MARNPNVRIPFANIDFVDAVLKDIPAKGYAVSMAKVADHIEGHVKRSGRLFSFRDLYLFLEGSHTYMDLPISGTRNIVDYDLEIRLRHCAQLRLK